MVVICVCVLFGRIWPVNIDTALLFRPSTFPSPWWTEPGSAAVDTTLPTGEWQTEAGGGALSLTPALHSLVLTLTLPPAL